MVVITETSDDFNCGDPGTNKNSQQLQNKRKKVEKNTSFHIPDGIAEIILAKVRRRGYPVLTLVSKTFRGLIVTPRLHDLRLRLGATEPILYACVGSTLFLRGPRWCILYRKPYSNLPNTVSVRLLEIDSLPPMPWGSAVVTIGHEMYVIGGCVGLTRTNVVFVIDCRFHTYRFLPSMRVARCGAAAGVFNGKIFIVGGCEMRAMDWMETFDIKGNFWIRGRWTTGIPPYVSSKFVTYAVMEKKIYILGERMCYTYTPGEQGGLLEYVMPGEFMSFFWQESSCVIDGLLFSTNPQRGLGASPIIIYDPKQKIWRPLTGLQGFPANILLHSSKMANFGGKLVILGPDEYWYFLNKGKREIWCVEIALERRQGGEISGKVESVAVVLTVPQPESLASIDVCATVTI
ncbi:hypothetical protein EUTSA_v10015277mg [Eutrema salsugineum]|uniref:FKB95-like N-terminal Kelch domain-containing protein n=1 Tax=Eutrema salsugineum TaxID=72664 RepID=V4LU68_EUTSA|nr:putative F-box/kelch-repeat protein At2g21680 [Eutrema salsugineum]ESQ43448.1 hypothetical protein EUTSA_v10015277mg [Eutrema salsugineum]